TFHRTFSHSVIFMHFKYSLLLIETFYAILNYFNSPSKLDKIKPLINERYPNFLHNTLMIIILLKGLKTVLHYWEWYLLLIRNDLSKILKRTKIAFLINIFRIYHIGKTKENISAKDESLIIQPEFASDVLFR
ncbi:hypothetical protein ACJX0J_029454, partial [Zea mays]